MSNPDGRIARFHVAGRDRIGLVTDDGVIDLADEMSRRYPGGIRQVIAEGALGELVLAGQGRAPDFADDAVQYLVPIANPEKIICIGVNYPDRNAEYKDGQAAPSKPSLFVRFARSFVGHRGDLVRPLESEQLDYEGEVVVVIGKAGRRIARADALHHVAAITLANEGTVRDWVRHAKFNVTQGKNWDKSGAMGPWLVPFTDPAQLEDIELTTRVNGELRQQDRTSRMIFDFRFIISYVSTFTTLVPGDVLVCGTPTGAGARFDPPIWLTPGDTIEVSAQGIGTLVNGVCDEAPD